jgi:two-component system LytT family response regulator
VSEPPPPPIRTLLVDDEPLARSTLRVLLAADPEIAVVGEHGNGRDAALAIRRDPPDLLFLDVQMPGMDGFRVLEEAGAASRIGAVVFVTAFEAHAVRAFEVSAVDYLLKPFDDDRFQRALARAKAHVRRGRTEEIARKLAAVLGAVAPPPAPPEARPASHLSRIAIRSAQRVTFVPVADVDWIEAEDYYVAIHAGGKAHLLRESMRDLEAQLDPGRFFRVHRSAIVNVLRIREVRALTHGEGVVVLQDGTELKVSRGRKEQLYALLGLAPARSP